MRIKDIDHALALYEKHNIIRGEALEEGNSSKANYHFDKVQEIIGFLKEQDAITELFKYLKHPHPYVRLNAAVQLKDHDEKGCLEVVKSIEKNEKGIVSLDAKLCIQAFWKKSISEKDAKINNTPTERIIIENRAAFIVNLLFSIVLVVLTYMCYPNWGLTVFFSLGFCLTIYLVRDKYLHESFFIINKVGFSYGERKRHGEKRILYQTDYKWAEIKELYFKQEYKNRTYLVVVLKTKGKQNMGHRKIPFSNLPFDTHLRPLKEMKSLIKEYSQRDDIFRKQNMLLL